MKIKEIFELAIQIGIDNDPRGRKKIEKILAKRKEEFDELPEKKKKEYDLDRLTNPYSDTNIQFVPDMNKEVKTVLVGIDADPSEILLANELNKQGRKIDLIIGHHPIGKSLANLGDVMDMQIDVMEQEGVPGNIAEKIMEERISQIGRSVAPVNHYQSADTAKLLNIPLVNIHTPADNSVFKYVKEIMDKKKPETVGEIVDLLKEIPEYAEGMRLAMGPVVFSGSEKSRAGKILLGMTGGTGGSEKIYEKLGQYGIGTVIDMHIGEKHREEAAKHYINVVIAGHMASDSLGLNIIMDELEKRGVEIIPCSGFIRHSRIK
ncbi:MAG: NGG1p interacting factor NIF3 [Patescibacteria group bacterium]|jgi:putative NIF3 family GTP cyclohydrolase 1 type 2